MTNLTYSFARVVGRAATGALNLGVLGLAVLAALALASWPIGALGGAAYAALVAADAANANFRRRVLCARAPAKLPRGDAFSFPPVRAAAEAIALARAEVEAVVRATPERLRRSFAVALHSLDELEGHGAALARRCDELASYLATVRGEDIEREIAALEQRAAAARDRAARDDYAAAAGAARERLATTHDIANGRDRILAHLARIAATMKGVPAKLVRLRALDEQATDALTGDVGAELDRMNIDLKAFEQTLESIVTLDGGAPGEEVHA
jgi:hypothetical protein